MIAIRLAIINEIYLFIVFNIVLTYFLVINKYLILSSLFTIIIVFAKFTFHLCDYTIKDFFKNIQPFVFQTAEESLKWNKENILFVGIFVSRMFYLEQKAKEEIYTQASKKFSDEVTSDYLFPKLKRIQHPLIERLADFARILSLNDKSDRRLDTLLQGRMRIFFQTHYQNYLKKNKKIICFFQSINICIIILLLCLFLQFDLFTEENSKMITLFELFKKVTFYKVSPRETLNIQKKLTANSVYLFKHHPEV